MGGVGYVDFNTTKEYLDICLVYALSNVKPYSCRAVCEATANESASAWQPGQRAYFSAPIFLPILPLHFPFLLGFGISEGCYRRNDVFGLIPSLWLSVWAGRSSSNCRKRLAFI